MRQYTKNFNKVISSRSNEIALFLLGVYVGFFTLGYSQNEDMGIFLSETSLIAKGHGVYSEIFEVKDPLFLWLGGLTNKLFGLNGPYLLDVLFVIFSPLVAYMFARSIELSKTWATVLAIVFCGSLAGTYYQTLRTGTIALVLIVVTLTFSYQKKWILTGIFCVLVVGFKMAYTPILIGVFASLLFSSTKLKALTHFTLGVASTSALIIGTLWYRGELSGFVDMVQLNFHYRKIFPEAIGFKPGVKGHIDVINSNSSSFPWLLLGLLFLIFLFLISIRANKTETKTQVPLLLTFGGVLVFLLASAMWIHHLQPLSIVALVTIALIGKAHSNLLLVNHNQTLVRILCILIFFTTLNTTGWKFPIKPSTPIANWLSPRWNIPPEIEYLRLNSSNMVLERNFARLGPNDDMGLAAFLPADWKLVCRDYAHYGHETEELVTEIVDCLKEKPNYVFVSPGFFPLTRLSGTYELLKKLSAQVLLEYYECVPVEQRPGAEFCNRKQSVRN